MLAKFAYIFVSLALAVTLVLGGGSPCRAAAPGSSELGIVDSIGGVTDILVGHNNKGPYYLSWNNVSTDMISVVVNGRMLKKGVDYTIDPTKGIMSFTSVVATDAIVRVSYQTVPGKSTRTASGASIPVSLKLRDGDSGSLSVTGLYMQNDPKNPDAGRSILGIGGDRKWTQGKFSSQFLVSQANDDSIKGGTWDRSAMKLGGDTALGAFKFSGSYLHAGQTFAGGKEYGTGVGKDVLNLATSVAPSKSLAASASYTSTEDTVGEKKGQRSVVSKQDLSFAPIDSTKLSFSHSTSELTDGKGKRSNASTSSYNFASTAIKRVSLRSTMTQKFSDAAGEERAFSAGMTAKPTDTMSLEFGYGTLENKVVGQQTSTDLKIAATPVKQVAVAAGYSTLENKIVGQQTATDLKVTASPIKDVALQAAYSDVDSTVAGSTTKTNIALQATPIANMQLKASMADSVVNENRTFQRDFSLTGTPLRYAKLVAMYSQKGLNNLDDVTQSAQLELTPLRNTKLSAGYKYAEVGPKSTTIYDYYAQSKPLDFVNFVGSYRLRDTNLADAPDSSSLSLSVGPKAFALTGEYQSNPETKEGAVQDFDSTAVGIKTRVGSVGIETNYLEKNDRVAATVSDEKKLSFALPVFGHGKLTTGCKFGRTLGKVDQESRTYMLGYQHSIGSDFSLSFTGHYTKYMRDKMAMPGKDEITAEASLGAKF